MRPNFFDVNPMLLLKRRGPVLSFKRWGLWGGGFRAEWSRGGEKSDPVQMARLRASNIHCAAGVSGSPGLWMQTMEGAGKVSRMAMT